MSAKSNVQRRRKATTRSSARPSSKPGRKKTRTPATTSSPAEKKKSGLSKLLSPQNIQESLKSVGNLRSMVKNWLSYLQQADTLLDTVYVTSNSLKESGVLEKIVKQRGKNLTTDDFTNILIALMNSPMGSQVLKSIGSSDSSTEKPATEPE